MVGVGILRGAEEEERGQGVRFRQAGVVRHRDDLTLLERRVGLRGREWADLAGAASESGRLGLAVLARLPGGTAPPENWTAGLPRDVICGWIATDGESAWRGEVCEGGTVRPVEGVVVLEPAVWLPGSAQGNGSAPDLSPEVWDPVRGGIGDAFDRVRGWPLVLFGSGRAAGRMAETAVSTGFWDLAVVDNDTDEPRNRTGPLGTKPREPRPKPPILGSYLRSRFEGVLVREVVASASQRPVLSILRRRPIVVTAGDSEALRLIGACYASCLGVPHLDVGAGVHEDSGEVLRGGQVVFVPPQDGCVACVRGLRWDEVERDLEGDASTQLDARQRGERRGDTLGTVPDLLARVTGTGMGILRRWLGGEEEHARRLLLFDGGLSEELPRASRPERCPVCALSNSGEALLSGLFPALGEAQRDGGGGQSDGAGIAMPDSELDLEEVLSLIGIATAEVLLGGQDTALWDLALGLAGQGLRLEMGAVAHALDQRLPAGQQGQLALVAVNDSEEVWRADSSLGPVTVRFRPERRWLPLARSIRERVEGW